MSAAAEQRPKPARELLLELARALARAAAEADYARELGRENRHDDDAARGGLRPLLHR